MDSKAILYKRATTTGIPVRRGVSTHRPKLPYQTDPGDFGRGIYYTTNYYHALQYAKGERDKVSKEVIKFENPLVLDADEAYALANKYETIVQDVSKAPEDLDSFKAWIKKNPYTPEVKLKNAERLTRDMIDQGYDGLIVIQRERLEIVDYRPYI